MATSSYAGTDDAAPGRAGRVLAFAYFLVFALALCTLGAMTFFGHASDGDPVARLAMPVRHVSRAAPIKSASLPPPIQNAGTPGPILPGPNAQVPPNAPPPSTVTPGASEPPTSGPNLTVDPALIEKTAEGPLPRIANDGRTPMNAYAPPATTDKGFRIAIVISGLGISAKGTALAIQQLPPAVTLAFAPYESDVAKWVAEARRQGHEVLLEVPMEPYDFPDSDPGPHTLRAAVGEETNTQRLQWAMTRFTGYAGITNLLGGRLLADGDSLEPIMTYVARRGLLFYDSGPQNRSVAPEVAKRINAPYVQSEITLDTIQTGMEIDARLSELEKLARTNGSAAASGFLLPVTIDRVANWAKGLEGRGFVLVPASAIVAQSK